MKYLALYLLFEVLNKQWRGLMEGMWPHSTDIQHIRERGWCIHSGTAFAIGAVLELAGFVNLLWAAFR